MLHYAEHFYIAYCQKPYFKIIYNITLSDYNHKSQVYINILIIIIKMLLCNKYKLYTVAQSALWILGNMTSCIFI